MIKLEFGIQKTPTSPLEKVVYQKDVDSFTALLDNRQEQVVSLKLFSSGPNFTATNISEILGKYQHCKTLDLSYNGWIDDLFLKSLNEELKNSVIENLTLHMVQKITTTGIKQLKVNTLKTVQATSCPQVRTVPTDLPFALISNQWYGYV